ncbi:MAG: hypothetical protein JW801_16085 [Bacteroidales bacterium]|nr:hypothetical protein [Bacteroidales bacterium]
MLAEFRQNYKIPLLAYLKENLQNSLLEFEETILDIESSSITKHYTDLDKLKHMIEKNPALQKLRQEFNLDFD